MADLGPDKMKYTQAMIQNKATFRLTITLPSGVIIYKTTEAEWAKDEFLPLVEATQPLFEWAVEELEPWLEHKPE